MKTFEDLYQITSQLEQPPADDQRQLEWCDENEVLALAREQGGGYEIFMTGPALQPTSQLVRRHLKHDRWLTHTGQSFEANRLVLPRDAHYIPVAALLAEELLRNGVQRSAQSAFAMSEPLIEMALRRAALDEESVLGLIAELQLLETLMITYPDLRAQCLESWQGHDRGRDFVFDGVQVEVKATRGPRSVHEISSLAQVDPRRSASGEPVERLFLLSVGITGCDPTLADAVSLPSVVDSVLALLGPSDPQSRNDIQRLFLARIESYGPSIRRDGYAHDQMRAWTAYASTYSIRFKRLYDMNDESVDVLRRATVARCGHVSADTVTYTVELPDQIAGTDNPRSDIPAFVSELSAVIG